MAHHRHSIAELTLAVFLAAVSLIPSLQSQGTHRAILSKAAVVGGLAALTLVSYLYATREATLIPVMIAIALYPALPVILSLVVLKNG
ncbi:hypothetical protein EB835_20070 [Brevibacterium sp. S22]|nr:hypothetical protein EB835_20070 [Brevibacterium sp. S22]